MTARVSVVTPFFNAGATLEECIRSVLAQSFRDFEYLLVNNCSTDDSSRIARSFAATDSRIRLIDNDTFLGQVDNYNTALARVSPLTEYCKIVQADDWIFKNCLEEMVALADRDPSIGIVSSYRMRNDVVVGMGLPLAAAISDGRSICRTQLLGDLFFFGSPTTLLFRSEILRSRRPFYASGRLHEDTEACYEILETWNFGFVHQVLSFTRTGNESIMSTARRFGPQWVDKLIVLRRFGPIYLSPDEFAVRWRRYESRYLDFLAEAVLCRREAEFWRYQRKGWDSIDYSPNRLRLAVHVVLALLDLALNPKSTVTAAARAIRSRLSARAPR